MIKSRRLRWAGYVAKMQEGRRILTYKPRRKIPLGRPRHILEDNIKMDFKETGVNPKNWVASAQDKNY